MERTILRRKGVPVIYVALAVLALANGGCLLIAAGAAAGGAAGYAYYKGKVCNAYNADLANTRAAVHTALAELGMPVESEEQSPDGGFLLSRTTDGDAVRINLEPATSPIPAENPLTRVSVRVATFGDQQISERVLFQVSAHLVPGAAPPVLGPVQPAALAPNAKTAEPPLAN
jgi:hypothetical protein